jgi:hypothetical protein
MAEVRKLYFDIDGTILDLESGNLKPVLGGGRLGRAIRDARIGKLICVGNFVEVIRTLWTVNPGYDGLGSIFELCRGAFDDEAWFRAHTALVERPASRAAEVELTEDWWYMDDLAETYFAECGRTSVYLKHLGGRILRPSPTGDGQDVLDWLRAIARPTAV